MRGSDEVHVWWLLTEPRDGDGEEFAWILSAREQSRRAQLADAHDRRDYAAAHALLRVTLSMYGNLPDAKIFERGDFGKP